MNSNQKTNAINKLMNTSVDDCKINLTHYSDPGLLCDLLIECRAENEKTREKYVRQRISYLIKN